MTRINQVNQIRKNGSTIEFICDYCEVPATQKLSAYKRKNRHFCSTYCYTQYRKESLPKEEHNRYGTGLPEEERKKRTKVRSDLNHAVRDGKLCRLPCSICGAKSEAHHPDYNDPLNVIWLCFKHHRAIYENPDLLDK